MSVYDILSNLINNNSINNLYIIHFSTPSYAPLTGTNSSVLPACFVLKLAKKMPMCMELVRRIQKVTELECGDISAPHPLLSLIIQHASEGQLDCRNNRGLYVVCKLFYMIINY